MSFGLNVYNDNGERVVEFKQTLYAARSGNTRLWQTVIDEAKVIAGNPASFAPIPLVTISSTSSFMPHHVAEQNPYAATLNGKSIVGPELNLNLGDMVFFKLSTYGIYAQGQLFCDLPGGYPVDKGACLVVTNSGATGIPYIVASAAAGAASGENYGLILRDENNVVTFDSRKPLFSIFYAANISKTVFDSVLNTGTAYNLTLPKSVAGAYIAAPAFLNFKRYSNGDQFYVLMQQTSNTNIRFSRVNGSSGGASGTLRFWTQDTPIFVGRPI